MDEHRYKKLQHLKDSDILPYVNSFKVPFSLAEIKEKYEGVQKSQLMENKYRFTVAGRVMSIREFGKAAFITIKDRSASFQIYLKKGEITEEEYEVFKSTDVGDF
ncbi:MAG TPA: lysine--tRNA ligase, partial [Flexistipes sinusarabici]|nr:lysine--tRNA ligase [Flexistipes sinusarabici]